jgi:hypothetical protein
MRALSVSLNLFACLLSITLLITACGGSNDNSTPETTDPPPVENDNDDADPVEFDSSILKVSNVSTMADPGKPTIVFNQAGDGISVWEVSSAGVWLYYALYDRASDRWSQPQQLAAIETDYWSYEVQVVSSDRGFAVAWEGRDYNLFVGLFHDGEWKISEISAHDNDSVGQFRLASNGAGYLITWTHQSNTGVYASLSHDAVNWSANNLLYQTDGSGYTVLDAAISNGAGYLVSFFKSNQYQILTRLYDGTVWQDTEQLIDIPIDPSMTRLSSNGQGYSLVWSDYGEQSTRIWNRTYTATSGWGASRMIASYDSQLGDLIYVWQFESDGKGYCVSVEHNHRVITAIVDPLGNGNWGSSVEVFSTGSDEREIRKHSLVPGGDGYAVFLSEKASEAGSLEKQTLHYHGRVYRDGNWSVDDSTSIPVVVYDVYDSPYMNASIPIDGAGANGEYAVALIQQESGSDRLAAYQYSYDSAWTEMEQLENDPVVVNYPVVVANPASGVSVVWSQVDDSGESLSTYSNRLHEQQWSGRQMIYQGNDLLGSSFDTQLIAGANGETLAIWSQDRNGDRALMANIMLDGVWGEPSVLADRISQAPPVVAKSNHGYVAVWEEKHHEQSYSLKAISFDGENWSEPTLLHTSPNRISAAMASNGTDFQVVYMDVVYSPYSVNFLARLFDGHTWHESVTIAEGVYSESKYPQIASNGSTFRVVWMQGDLEDMNIYSSEFDGEIWGARQTVSAVQEQLVDSWTFSRYYLNLPVIASNGNGYGVFWFDGTNVKASLYTDQWSEPELLGRVDVLNYYDEGPIVTSNGSGYAVAWFTQTEPDVGVDYSALYANIYDGSSWRGAANLSGSVSTLLHLLDFDEAEKIVSVSGDRYGIVWGTRYDNYMDFAGSVYARIFDRSGWSANRLLNRSWGEIDDYQLAGDGEGFLAAWRQLSVSGQFKLLTNQFDDDGWGVRNIVNESEYDKYDLNLIGGERGYQAIWTGAEPGGEPWVRIPWSTSAL